MQLGIPGFYLHSAVNVQKALHRLDCAKRPPKEANCYNLDSTGGSFCSGGCVELIFGLGLGKGTRKLDSTDGEVEPQFSCNTDFSQVYTEPSS